MFEKFCRTNNLSYSQKTTSETQTRFKKVGDFNRQKLYILPLHQDNQDTIRVFNSHFVVIMRLSSYRHSSDSLREETEAY